MTSKIIFHLFIFFTLFFISFHLHTFVNEKVGIELPFNLRKIYLFHAVFSALICFNFGMLSNVDKVFQQLAFIYLAALVLKIILFSIVFYKPVFSRGHLTNQEAISLLIPMAIFLLTEAIFVIKIIKKNNLKTIK